MQPRMDGIFHPHTTLLLKREWFSAESTSPALSSFSFLLAQTALYCDLVSMSLKDIAPWSWRPTDLLLILRCRRTRDTSHQSKKSNAVGRHINVSVQPLSRSTGDQGIDLRTERYRKLQHGDLAAGPGFTSTYSPSRNNAWLGMARSTSLVSEGKRKPFMKMSVRVQHWIDLYPMMCSLKSKVEQKNAPKSRRAVYPWTCYARCCLFPSHQLRSSPLRM
jgi:hypothetical protein